MNDKQAPTRLVVLISGNGSNLQAIIDAVQAGRLAVRIAAVISNRPQAGGLARARQAGIPAVCIDHRDYDQRSNFDQALQTAIDDYAPDVVALAGFMRILSAEFVNHYQGRLLNIHPSLLPALRGLHTHQRALEAGLSEHGATVHFVTADLDGGPAVLQARIAVQADDTVQTLQARVLNEEHRIYPLAIAWFAAGRLRMQGQQVMLDGQPLERPVVFATGAANDNDHQGAHDLCL